MIQPARLAVRSLFAVFFLLHFTCAVKLPDSLGAQESGDLRSGLSASYGSQDSWNNGFSSISRNQNDSYGWDRNTKVETKGYVKITETTYEEGKRLAAWVIAVAIVVPLLILIGIIVLCVCVCRICARRKVHTTTYVYQGGPPPYPATIGAQMNNPI